MNEALIEDGYLHDNKFQVYEEQLLRHIYAALKSQPSLGEIGGADLVYVFIGIVGPVYLRHFCGSCVGENIEDIKYYQFDFDINYTSFLSYKWIQILTMILLT